MQVDILTPERELFSGEAQSVEVPGTQGRFEVLNDHAPLISALQLGKIRLTTAIDTNHFEIESGFIEVLDNKIALMVEQTEAARKAQQEKEEQEKAK
jgi:F-type H+-transporting ATPase subunit epsilon